MEAIDFSKYLTVKTVLETDLAIAEANVVDAGNALTLAQVAFNRANRERDSLQRALDMVNTVSER